MTPAPRRPELVLAAMQAKLAALLVLLAFCGWLVFRPTPRSAEIAPLDALTADATLADSATLDAPTPERAGTTARAEAKTTAAIVFATDRDAAPPAAELTPGRDLAVRVVDAHGAAILGATVVIWSGAGSAARDILRARTTAPNGEAHSVHLATQVERSYGDTQHLSLGLELAGETAVRAALDIDALPHDPIVLVAPAHGRLDVRFVDATGVPFLFDEWIYLTPYFPDPLRPIAQRSGTRIAVWERLSSTASFPIVEPGIALQFEVHDNGIRSGTTREIAPLAPGEVRAIEVVLGETLPHVVGRVVDEAGAPIPAGSIDVRFEPIPRPLNQPPVPRTQTDHCPASSANPRARSAHSRAVRRASRNRIPRAPGERSEQNPDKGDGVDEGT